MAANKANFEIHHLQPVLASPSGYVTTLRSTSQAFRDIKPLEIPLPDEQKDDGQTSGGSTGTQQPASTPPAASPTTATSPIGKEADKLAAQITALSESLSKSDKKTDGQIGAMKKELTELKGKLAKLEAPTKNVESPQGVSITLATKLTDMFAAMRPVNAVLTRAYSLKPYVKSIPECQPLNAQLFEFAFDAGEVTLNPGQSFEVAVKGGVGVPNIWMSGAKGDTSGEMPKFTTLIEGGVAKAKLILLSTTPPGEMYIMAVDGSGKQRDEIKVIVVPAKK